MNCLEVKANFCKDRLVSLSGDLACNVNVLCELLGMRDGNYVSVLSFDESYILFVPIYFYSLW